MTTASLVVPDLAIANERIAAALALHRPCHDETTEPWGCEWGCADLECVTGIPDQPGWCTYCTYDDRQVAYPCPTVAALHGDAPKEETPRD